MAVGTIHYSLIRRSSLIFTFQAQTDGNQSRPLMNFLMSPWDSGETRFSLVGGRWEKLAEEKILSQPKGMVSLKPKRGLGGRFLRGFSVFLGGMLLRRMQTGAFLDAFTKGEVEAGDIDDVTDKVLKVRELILTNKSIAMRYQKGTFSKKDKAISLPLEYAKSVEEKSILGTKHLEIKFVVPGEEKPVEFALTLADLKQREVWLRELSRIISSPLGA